MTSVDYSYTRMTWDEAWPGGIEALAFSHFIETGEHRYDQPTVDVDMYRQADAAGILYLYVCQFHKQIVGYASFIVTPHNHYKGVLHANHDTIYISPAHRGWTARHLIQFAEDDMRKAGVSRIFQGTLHHGKDYGRVLASMGYQPVETVYSKYL